MSSVGATIFSFRQSPFLPSHPPPSIPYPLKIRPHEVAGTIRDLRSRTSLPGTETREFNMVHTKYSYMSKEERGNGLGQGWPERFWLW